MRTMRAMCGWYGLAGSTGLRTGTSAVAAIPHSSQAVDHFHDVDLHRAGGDAAPASHAARPAVLGHESALLVIETELDAAGARLAEIGAAGHQRVRSEQARVPRPGAGAVGGTESHLVGHVVA